MASALSELSIVTRRAFVPKLVTQIYNTSPLLSAMLKHREQQVQEATMPPGVEPLHLTEENKEDIRRLVRKMLPNFERDLADELREAQMASLAQAQQQAANAVANQMAGAVFAGTTGTVFQPNPWQQAAANPHPLVTLAGGGLGFSNVVPPNWIDSGIPFPSQ